MTDEKKSKIEALAKRVHETRLKYEYLGMTNSSGRTPDEALRLTQDYELARAEYWEAQAELEAEQRP